MYHNHFHEGCLTGYHEAGHALVVLALGGDVTLCETGPGRGLTRFKGLDDDEAAIVLTAGSQAEFLYERDVRRSRPNSVDFGSPYREIAAGDWRVFQSLKTNFSWYLASAQASKILERNRDILLVAANTLQRCQRLTAADFRQLEPYVKLFLDV